MSNQRFLYGPRDTGPADPPPWPDIVITVMGFLVSAVSLGVGLKYEWICDVYVQGPCALLFIIGLMPGLACAGDGMDKAFAEHAAEEKARKEQEED